VHVDEHRAVDVTQHALGRPRLHEGTNLAPPVHGRHSRSLPNGILGEQVHERIEIPGVDRERVARNQISAGQPILEPPQSARQIRLSHVANSCDLLVHNRQDPVHR
jgi:hypothetical protein